MAKTIRRRAESQAGFSLAIVLIFMVILTMVGITAMQSAGLQERMAGHSRDRNLAFEAAESALRTAEARITNFSPFDYTTTCTGGLCLTGSSPDPLSYTWNDDRSLSIDHTLAANRLPDNLAANPRFFAELAGVAKCSGCGAGSAPIFRVTARSTGRSAQTSVVLQSTIR